MTEQPTLPFQTVEVARYLQQLPDAAPCPRCGRPRVTDWLGVHIHTDTIKQTCKETTR